MNRIATQLALLAGLAIAAAGPAYSLSGTFAYTSPVAASGLTVLTPVISPGVGNGLWDDESTFYAFVEKTVLLGSPLAVDVDSQGPIDGLIAAGTMVVSHYLFFDPSGSQGVSGTVTFDAPILGVIHTRAKLDGTNAGLGLSPLDVTYVTTNGAIGLEPGDSVPTVLGNVLTIAGWTASDPGDHIRVLTAVPEPGTYALMIAGLAMLGFMARRRVR